MKHSYLFGWMRKSNYFCTLAFCPRYLLPMKQILFAFNILFFILLSYPLLAFQDADCVEISYQKLRDKRIENNEAKAIAEILQSVEPCFIQRQETQGLLKCKELRVQLLLIDKNYEAAYQLLAQKPIGIEQYPKLEGEYYYHLMTALRETFRIQEAYEVSKKAIALFEKHQMQKDLVDFYLYAGELGYKLENNFREVVYYLQKAEQLAQIHLSQTDEIFKYLYQSQGAIYYEMGNFEKAIEYAQKSIAYEQNAPKVDTLMLATLYYNQGGFYEEMMDLESALTYFQSAVPLFESLGNPYPLAELYKVIGDIHRKRDNKKEAEAAFFSCLQLAKKMGWNPKRERLEGYYSYSGVAAYYRYKNRPDSILAYLLPKIPDIEAHKLDPSEAYKNLGYAYEQKGEMEKAEYYMRKTLDYNRKRFNNTGNNLASDYLRLSYLYSKKQDWQGSMSMLDSVLNLLLLSQENANELIHFDQILDHGALKLAYHQRGQIHFAEKNYNQAYLNYEKAIALLHYLKDKYASNASKQYSLDQLRPLYEAATHAAYKLYEDGHHHKLPDELKDLVFEYAENSKATLLNESIIKFRSHYKETIGIPDSVLMEEEFLLKEMESYRADLHNAKQRKDAAKVEEMQSKVLTIQQKLKNFENNLDKNYPDYRTLREMQHTIVNIENLQKSLDAETVLVEYFISENQCFIFYVSREHSDLKIIDNHSLEDLRNNIKDLRMTMTDINYLTKEVDKGYQIFINKAYYLYDQYLKHPMLKDKRKLVIVPDRDLNYIPYEVLLTAPQDATATANYTNLPYLIRDYVIRYEYSATVMVNHKKSTGKRGNGRVLGFAPEYEQNVKWDELPPKSQQIRTQREINIHNVLSNLAGAHKELEMLQTWSDGDFFYNERGTERRLKERLIKPYSVVHLAMHGIVDFDHPSYSSLVFTEDRDSLEDNLLYAYEINHLDCRNIELVVLSACQTGYGKYSLGEGVVSLGRSFMHAGVSSIVSTLWELNDQSSVELMQLFYRNLSLGKAKDEALRDAKLEYIEKHPDIMSHPFFWAGLVQFGDPAPIQLHYNRGVAFLGLVFGGMFICLIIGLILLYYNNKKKKKKAWQRREA